MRFKVKKWIKRIAVFFVVFIFAFCAIFVSVRPVETKAEVFTLAALGGGALAAVVAAYFATSGIQFSGDGLSGDFVGNYVANWVKSQGSFANNPYFNVDGEYIGSNDQLSIVQNDNTSAVSIIFGKEFAIWLEALKSLFVSDNSLIEGVDTSLSSSNYITSVDNVLIPFVTAENSNFVSASAVDSMPEVLPLEAGSSFFYNITDNYSFGFQITTINTNGDRFGYSYVINNNGAITSGTASAYFNLNRVYKFFFVNLPSPYGFNFQFGGITSTGDYYQNGALYPLDIDISDLSSSVALDGVLTDGYDDFADAVSGDLDAADDDDVLVVGLGDFADFVNPSDLVDAILDKIAAQELNPTYEGVREDQESAEEETEGEKPFSPTVPEGWVTVSGLQDFFPFCIPWDLYNVIALLNVPPEAPVIDWNMSFAGRFEEHNIHMDFSAWEPAARIFRVLLVIGFLIFLILKTRDLVRG